MDRISMIAAFVVSFVIVAVATTVGLPNSGDSGQGIVCGPGPCCRDEVNQHCCHSS